jgi:hypothetical protein
MRPLPRHRPAQVLQLPRRRRMEGSELQHVKCERSGYVPIKIGGFMGIGEFIFISVRVWATCVNDDACFVYRRNRRRGEVRNVLVSFF